MAPISLVDLPVSRTGPDPSGSAGSSRLCRGCSHPPRQPADQAASSFTPPLRRQGHGVFHLHPKQQRLVAQSYVFDICRTSSTSSLTTCDLVSQPTANAPPTPHCGTDGKPPTTRSANYETNATSSATNSPASWATNATPAGAATSHHHDRPGHHPSITIPPLRGKIRTGLRLRRRHCPRRSRRPVLIFPRRGGIVLEG